MKDSIKSSLTINGTEAPEGHRMIAALIKGSVNGVPLAYLEFTARNKKLDLGELVGSDMGFEVTDEEGKAQPFWGTCVSAEVKGIAHSDGHYVVEIRPWLWFLSRTKNNRIFQEKKTTDIVKEILGEYGFSAHLEVKHSKTEPLRTYCVQYGETDLTFIKRLLEEEGIYFYFTHHKDKVVMVLSDQLSAHPAAGAEDKYLYIDEKADEARERIIRWELVEKAVTGKVTLRDYDFTKPTADLTVRAQQESGSHTHKSYETYDYPARYSETSEGQKRANALMEEHAAAHQTWSAEGSILNLNIGKIFEIVDHPRHETSGSNGFMVSSMTQYISVGAHSVAGGAALLSDPAYWKNTAEQSLEMIKKAMEKGGGPDFDDTVGFFRTMFEAVKKSNPFRGASLTKRPYMVGVQTAVVTGASGDEVAVDKYGRIKVQFHWDREGKKDDKTSCWVRTMMPWTGKNWGMIALPRVGQEVVIQFEEGDPDRPLCVGMLYNADTMPPYDLPGNATRTGIKTNSSKGGGGYNELLLEDKKGDELVRFMAEKDYVQNVQNQAHIKVGYPHEEDVKKATAQDDKSMKLEVQNHLDEVVETGDHSFAVQAGQQTIDIKKDKTETIEGKSALTITKDKTTTVKQGNVAQDVKMGNVAETIDKGNKSTKVKLGNISVDADLGKIDITAMQSITLKVGGSTIKVDQSGVSIKGIMVKIEGTAMFDAKAPMSNVKGDAMLILKGGVTMIN